MQMIKKEKTQDFKILNKKTSGIPLRDNRTLFITYDEPDTFPALLRQKRDQHPCRYGRPDHSRNIAGHAILRYMIFRITFQSNVIGLHGQAIGTALSPVAPISGLIFFLVEQIHQFHKEDTARNRQGKSQEAADHDADSRPVQESLARHRSAHTTDPRKMVAAFMMLFGCRIEQTAGIGTDLFHQVTEHQHTDQRHCTSARSRATTVVTAIGKIIFSTRRFFNLRLSTDIASPAPSY